MQKEINQYVYRGRHGWAVTRSGAARNVRVFQNLNQAMAFARRLARKHKRNLYLHEPAGVIRREEIYGLDPKTQPVFEF